MSYLVIPRKYRPKTFDEIVGQEPIVRTLKGALSASRAAQAYLFCGPHGVGKTSTARILAKAVSCVKGPTPEPCLACDPCKDIAAGRDLDVREVNGADNRGVDEVRLIIEDVRFAPSRNRKKVFIIDEVHQLTEAAFNALLKTLEEPPEHVLFILATTQPNDIPATILSRCQRYDFRRASQVEVRKRLRAIAQAEGIDVSDTVLAKIAAQAAGSIRDSQKILDQLIAFAGTKIEDRAFYALLGLTPAEEIAGLVDEIADRNVAAVVNRVDRLYREGRDVAEFVEAMTEHLRTLLVASYPDIDPEVVDVPEEERERYARQAARFTREGLVAMIQTLLDLDQRMRRPGAHRVLLEVSFVKLTELSDLTNLSDVLERLSALELAAPAAPSGPRPVAPAPAPTRPAARSAPPAQAPGSPAPPPAPPRAEPAHPAAPAQPLELPQAWARALETLAREDRGLTANMEMGQLGGWDGSSVVVRFQPQLRFFISQIQDTERLRRFEKTLSGFLGKPATLRFVIDEAPRGGAEQDARANPVVKDVVAKFDGQIIDVKKKNPPRGGSRS